MVKAVIYDIELINIESSKCIIGILMDVKGAFNAAKLKAIINSLK